MKNRHHDILSTVGDTPVVRLNRLSPEGRTVHVKVEAFNPLGSVKDRLAVGILDDAERRGVLKPGQTVVEATSGNTGLGLAMACAARGYPFVAVMAENFSLERRRLLRFLGARVVLTPAPLRGTGMLAKAEELAAAHGWFLCRQFENPANAEVHARTTAREILRDFEGERLDAFVTGFGTGGTLQGVARVLKAERPETRIVVAEPDNSRILASGVPQLRRDDGAPAGSHPAFRTHPIQGWSPDFIPRLAEEAEGLVDETVAVAGEDALRLARELARREGILAGISSGATLGAAIELAKRLEPGAQVLCMLPDTGERYLSTPLFQDVPVEMNEEELELSRSTPAARFDACAAPAAAAPTPVTEAARAFVEEATSDPASPVVVFGLEWCEFCWAVRRLFDANGVPFRSISLDSAEAQRGGWGDDVRAALRARTDSATVPQVFVGGELVGGCDDVFAAWRDGSLPRRLEAAGVAPGRAADARAADSLLPAWLHPR